VRGNQEIIKNLPSIVTAIRLGFVPLLDFFVSNWMLFYSATLFLLILCLDYLDGYLAKRLKLSSRFGAFFDATTDFVLIFSVFVIFASKGSVPNWVLILIAFSFVQFIATSLYWNIIYDPVGKYYGSLLYGAIGLRFIINGPFFYYFATVVITVFTAVSIPARFFYSRSARRSKSKAKTSR
jgi:phosphatidylglycerophosphate synthase